MSKLHEKKSKKERMELERSLLQEMAPPSVDYQVRHCPEPSTRTEHQHAPNDQHATAGHLLFLLPHPAMSVSHVTLGACTTWPTVSSLAHATFSLMLRPLCCVQPAINLSAHLGQL